MSLFGALFAGVSGLNAQSAKIGTISDNLANVNTVGYKRVKTDFTTLVTGAGGGNAGGFAAYSPGGVASATTYQIDARGLLFGTDNTTDLAINGDGFFVVRTDNGTSATPSAETFYTRAGSFTPDNAGYLKNTGGYFLYGWPLDTSGALPANTSSLTSVTAINVTNVGSIGSATSTASVGANLQADAATGTVNYTDVVVYDTLGGGHTVRMRWEKLAANSWELTYSVTGGATVSVESSADAVTANTMDDPSAAGNNRLIFAFNSSGALASVGMPDAPNPNINVLDAVDGSVDFVFNFSAAAGNSADASASQAISIDFGTVGASDGMTQLSIPYSTNFTNQNGIPPGDFVGAAIDVDGYVAAQFSNGQIQRIAKIPLADFPNPNGLGTENGNAYRQTQNSGTFILRDAGTSGVGSISPSTLEASDVDIAEEFTQLITTQRAYSANTRIITTAGEMLQELLQSV